MGAPPAPCNSIIAQVRQSDNTESGSAETLTDFAALERGLLLNQQPDV